MMPYAEKYIDTKYINKTLYTWIWTAESITMQIYIARLVIGICTMKKRIIYSPPLKASIRLNRLNNTKSKYEH